MREFADSNRGGTDVELLVSSVVEREPSRYWQLLQGKGLRVAAAVLVVGGGVAYHLDQANQSARRERTQAAAQREQVAAQLELSKLIDGFTRSRGDSIETVAQLPDPNIQLMGSLLIDGSVCHEVKRSLPYGIQGPQHYIALSVRTSSNEHGNPAGEVTGVSILGYTNIGLGRLERTSLTIEKQGPQWVAIEANGEQAYEQYCFLKPSTDTTSPVTVSSLPELEKIIDQQISFIQQDAGPAGLTIPAA